MSYIYKSYLIPIILLYEKISVNYEINFIPSGIEKSRARVLFKNIYFKDFFLNKSLNFRCNFISEAEVFWKIAAWKLFRKYPGESSQRSKIFSKLQGMVTPLRMFFWEFFIYFQNSFSVHHLWVVLIKLPKNQLFVWATLKTSSET